MRLRKNKAKPWIRWQAFLVGEAVLAGLIWLSLAQRPDLSISLSNVPSPTTLGVIQAPESTLSIEEKVFGYSTAGRPIRGYVIGSGAERLLLFASIHSNEKGTAVLLEKLVDEIRANPERIAKNKQIIVIPLLNPDGFYDRKDKLNANGVNLNLNFSTNDWKKYALGYFAGNAPFSEKESQVLRAVVAEYDPELMLAFHARGSLVNPEVDQISKRWALWYAGKTGYQYFTGWDYPGTATKWFYQTAGHPAVTIELTNYLADDWVINRPALWELVSEETITLPPL